MKAKHRVVVRLTPEHRKMLEELAKMEGTSMTEVVRRVIDRAYDELIAEDASTESDEPRGFVNPGGVSHDD